MKGKTNSRMNKRGVSPLIATVLLIAFAVALGAVVMNWGRQYVEDTTKFAKEKSNVDIKCGMDVGLKFIQYANENQICFNETTGEVNFTIENGPNVDITALQVRVYAQGGINITLIESNFPKAYVARYGVSYPTTFGNVTKIEIVPQIEVQGSQKKAFCPSNTLSEESLLQC